MANEPFLSIAIDVPLAHTFDYLPPAGTPVPDVGSRVLVPFRRRRQIGVVTGINSTSDVPRSRLRRVIECLDRTPLLGAADLELIRFASDYYHHPVGEVCSAALPALLRQGRPLNPVEKRYAVTDAGDGADVETLGRRAPRQAELLECLRDAGGDGLEAATLDELLPNWRRALRPLVEKGLATHFVAAAPVPDGPGMTDPQPGPTLNAEQQAAVEAIQGASGFRPFLLEGVTGSGKTEVYLRIIADVIAADRQALILVPEIGLTPQLVGRLATRLGIAPAVLHSGLSDAERLIAWRRARDGSATLVVGTRSAVFTPMPNLGLVVVDEEHDPSLKQQEGLRYSARDLAIVRAKRMDVPVILGSATPTLESLHHCDEGDYVHLELPQRAGAAQPPLFQLVDLARAATQDGLSDSLAGAIQQTIGAGNQALIYLNRRGYAPTLICTDCGHVTGCERCDSRMTVHAADASLRCHHCGARRPLPDNCGECGSAVRLLGEGTQRIEEALRARFPAARIRRIDSDTIQHKAAMESALSEAVEGAADILVGTQMLSKGHHFPMLTLVGVINADQGLFGTDFRASERLAQSIVQVAGRAGRVAERGRVIIQTAFAAHPFWQALLDGGYRRIAAAAMAEREESRWPPFTWLALVRAAAPQGKAALDFLAVTRRHIEAGNYDYLRVLGPVDAPMARRAGLHRAQLLLQSSSRRALHTALANLRPALESDPASRRVRWSIDVDPIELF